MPIHNACNAKSLQAYDSGATAEDVATDSALLLSTEELNWVSHMETLDLNGLEPIPLLKQSAGLAASQAPVQSVEEDIHLWFQSILDKEKEN